jgi:hypothetical protein
MLLAVFAVGCTQPAHKILTAENTYYFYLDSYNDGSCPTKYDPACQPKSDALNNLWTKNERAKAALKRGGDLPLQLKAVKDAEAKVKEVNK